MPMLNFHPAPGLGDLIPGWHTVPQNPLRPDSTPLVPTVSAAVGNRITRKPTIGDILPATFTVPQNPLIHNVPGSLAGLGCGCGCASGPPAIAMGTLPLDIAVPAGTTPYRYGFPPMADDARWFVPMPYYEQPSSEDMAAYGMGALNMDGTGLLGTGLFSGGMDVATWGTGEYVTAAVGVYALFSVFSTGKRHASTARRKYRAALAA
jgi:hypothetical protein